MFTFMVGSAIHHVGCLRCLTFVFGWLLYPEFRFSCCAGLCCERGRSVARHGAEFMVWRREGNTKYLVARFLCGGVFFYGKTGSYRTFRAKKCGNLNNKNWGSFAARRSGSNRQGYDTYCAYGACTLRGTRSGSIHPPSW